MIDGRRGRRRDTKLDGQDPKRFAQRPSLGARLVRLGVSADAVTGLGVVLAAGTAVLIGLGYFYIAVGLITLGGLMDTLDGSVAKAAGTSSQRGAFLDSVSDRVADAFLFGGVAWYLASGKQPHWALLPVAILGVSSIVSYERAKAESLGFSAKGGLMERAERLILLALALLIHVVLIPLLIALLVLTIGTAVGRFVRVWRQADDPPHPPRFVERPRAIERRSSRATTRRLRASRRSNRQHERLAVRLRSVLGSDAEGAGMRQRVAGRSRAAHALRRRVDDGR